MCYCVIIIDTWKMGKNGMDENTWRIVQIGMWLLGIQTTIILAVLGAFYSNMSKKVEKLEEKLTKVNGDSSSLLASKIDKLDEKITDIDRRVCRIEGAFQNKECCMIKDSSQMKKVE